MYNNPRPENRVPVFWISRHLDDGAIKFIRSFYWRVTNLGFDVATLPTCITYLFPWFECLSECECVIGQVRIMLQTLLVPFENRELTIISRQIMDHLLGVQRRASNFIVHNSDLDYRECLTSLNHLLLPTRGFF